MNHYLRLGKRWLREKSTVIIIHLQTCCSSPNTSRACNKVYQQEFAKKGGGMGGANWYTEGHTKNRIRELKQRRRRRQRERQKRVKGLDRQNNNSPRASRTFLCRHCTTTTWKCLISHFVANVNTRQLYFLFLNFNIQLQKKLPTFDELKETE